MKIVIEFRMAPVFLYFESSVEATNLASLMVRYFVILWKIESVWELLSAVVKVKMICRELKL